MLVDFVRIKTIKELKANVEKARSDELLKQEMWRRELPKGE